MFPPNGSATRRPLPSAGSPRVGFPDLFGTIERSDSLWTLSPRFVCASLGDTTPCRLSSLCSGPTHSAWGLGPSGLDVPECQFFEVGPQGVPSSRGTWWCLCRVLRPRRDRTHQALAVCRHGPRADKTEGSPRGGISGLNSTAWALAVYASSAPLRCRRPKTRFRLLARLYRVGLATHRVPTKGFADAIVTSSPPSPSFAWRNVRNLFRGNK